MDCTILQELSRKSACHNECGIMNFEADLRLGGIKHLLNYVCNASDRVNIQLFLQRRTYREKESLKDCRYKFAFEAEWKFFAFNILQR